MPTKPTKNAGPPLKDTIAVVAGASRGAGRGIAVALGEAGATVYVAGRTTRGGSPPLDGAPGTIDDTADEITARGGVGIAVRTDCTVEAEVASLFARVQRDHGRVDLLANAVWGAADGFTSMEDWMASWSKPFWELPVSDWTNMMTGGPFAYYLMATYAARAMAASGGGLVVGVTDGYIEGADQDSFEGYFGQLIWGLAHRSINYLMKGLSVEGKKHHIAAVTLMPGFMRTERVMKVMANDAKLQKRMRYDLSETPEYLGRAVAALAADRRVARKSGQICFVADLAQEYGFTDADGKQIPRFNPFG